MKALFPFLLTGALCSGSSCSPGPRINPFDEWGLTKIKMPAGNRPLSEMLLVCSRTAQANIFVDMDGVDPHQVMEPYKNTPEEQAKAWRQYRVGSVALQAQMFEDRNSENTYVMWRQPDRDKLARLILDWQQRFDETHPLTDRKSTLTTLQEFLKQKGWMPLPQSDTVAEKNQNAQGFKGSVRLSELPPILRDSMQAELVRQVRLQGNRFEPSAWTDEFWKDARVSLHLPRRDKSGHIVPGSDPVATIELLPPPLPGGAAYPMVLGVVRGVTLAMHQRQERKATSLLADLPRPRRRVCASTEDSSASTQATIGGVPATEIDPDPAFAFDASREKALQKQVAFIHQSVPPAQVVADLSKQSGVALRLSPDAVPDRAKMIAISQGMTLQDGMSALSRLYGAQWNKDDQGFELRSLHLDEMHTLLAHMGAYAYYPFAPHAADTYYSEGAGADAAAQIVDAVGATPLMAPEGVAFGSLPADVQKSALSVVREQYAGEVIVGQQRVEEVLSQNIELRLSPVPPTPASFFGKFGTMSYDLNGSNGDAILAAYTPDGRIISRLFPEFSIPKASALDVFNEQRREQSKRDQEEFDKTHPQGAGEEKPAPGDEPQ